MNEHDDAYVYAMLIVKMQANTRSITSSDNDFSSVGAKADLQTQMANTRFKR